MNTLTSNAAQLISLYYQASPSQHHNGINWYKYAQEFIADTSKHFDIPGWVVAAVISVTSPRKPWGSNKDCAYKLIEAYHNGLTYEDATDIVPDLFPVNRDKAWGILTGHNHAMSSQHEIESSYVRGPKVTAFYKNLLGARDVLTLDTHAVNAWLGYVKEKNSYSASQLGQARTDYITACKVVNLVDGVDISLCQFQAVVWVVWRDLHMTSKQVSARDYSQH